MLDLLTSRWVSDIISTAGELGLADHLQAGPKTAEELAEAAGFHAPSLYRLLRALASYGIFTEQKDGRFAQTPMSEALRTGVPYSVRGAARFLIRPWTVHSWLELGHSVRTGIPAFEHVHKTPSIGYLMQRPEEVEIFVEFMRSFSAQTGTALAESYDFSGINVLADIGGSQGLVLSLVMAKYPALRGILFDLPGVIEGAASFLRSQGLEDRVEVRSGSCFETAPTGADAYLLKHVLHDYSDEDCLRILKTVHTAAKPGTKLLVAEGIIESPNESQFAKTLDIQMLVHLYGKERTRDEWYQLLHQGGFRLSRIIRTNSFAFIIEAIRV